MKKKCTKCGEVKPLTLFSKDKSYKDGHHTWCKKCKNGRNTERRNTEIGYLKIKYFGARGKEFKKARWGRKSKCYFTFDELLAAFEKHKSIYGMRSAWGPGPKHLEQHLPITMINQGTKRTKEKHVRTRSNLSADRLDSNRDYTLQNIIFIRYDENQRKNGSIYEDCKIQIRLYEERFKNEME